MVSNSIALASSLENGCGGTSFGSNKELISEKTGKEVAKDTPSWAKGNAPLTTENGKQFVKKLCDGKYGAGKYRIDPGSVYNKIKK